MTAVEATPHLTVVSEAYRQAVHRRLVVLVGFSAHQIVAMKICLAVDDEQATAMVVVCKRMEEKSNGDVC